MHFSAPVDSAGFSRLDASSVPPDAAPAPISVWISSMKRIAFGLSLELLQHRLQALLEVAAVLGAGEQRAHVERVDAGTSRRISGTSPSMMRQRQALGDRGLADAGLADQQRVVLAAAAQHLDHALDLVLAADQRIDLAGDGERVQVLRVAARARRLDCVSGLGFAARPPARACPARLRRLGDAVRDEVDDVEARHALLVQEVDGVRVLLAEDRHQHVGAGDFLLARRTARA